MTKSNQTYEFIIIAFGLAKQQLEPELVVFLSVSGDMAIFFVKKSTFCLIFLAQAIKVLLNSKEAIS